jgi:hypothetical protein
VPPAVTITILAALGLTALWGMRAGWVHRGARTAEAVPALPAVPADGDPALGAPTTAPIEAVYVSSTVAGDWLERVVARDLGVRSGAVVQVFGGGVRIDRDGAEDLFVPAGALVGVGTAAGMAGKYVGGDGLVVLTWQVPGGARLDTGLRTRRSQDRAVLLAAAGALVPAAGTTTGTTGTTISTADGDAGAADAPTA